MKRLSIFMAALMLGISVAQLYAQDGPIYERGATYLENTVPPSPEPASQVKYADVPFTHSMGMAEYDIPFYTLQGRELSIPIGLHYASGGIKLDEIAGVAGLGWTLQAGGCITRTVMDMPDEYVPSADPFRHELPSGQLLSDLEDMTDSAATLSFLRDLVWNRIDASLDRYSYCVCGLSGSFVIQDNGEIFQLSGDGVIIDYTRAADGFVDEFILTGPDGTVYTMSLKEVASREGRGFESVGPMNGHLDEWTAPTSWYLTSIRSRSGLETAEFTYSEASRWSCSIRTRMESMFITSEDRYVGAQRSINTRTVESIYEPRVLTSIKLDSTTVSFSYCNETSYVKHTSAFLPKQNFPYRLIGMTVHMSCNDSELYKMKVKTGQDLYDGRVVLNGLELYRGGVLDDTWDFTYHGVNRGISTGSQDWYGYYNGENEFTDEGNNIICPYEVNLSVNTFSLTNGFPNAQYASYMSLTSVDHDDAETRFTYEGNSFTTASNTLSMGVRVKKITLPGNNLKPARVRYFTYEDPFSCGPAEPSPDMYATASMKCRRVDSIAFYDWSHTLHETPVTLGPSIRDSRIYYGKVTEDVSDLLFLQVGNNMPDQNTSRSVYIYSVDDVYPLVENCFDRFPNYSRRYYDGDYAPSGISPLNGLRQYYNDSGASIPPVLTRQESYVYEDGIYRLATSVDYEYNELARSQVLVDYHAEQVFHHWQDGYMTPDHLYHFPIYASGNAGRRPVKEIHVGYHASGNDSTIVNLSYAPRPTMSAPLRVASVRITEGKVLRQLNYVYADGLSGNDWVTTLRSQHCLSVPLERIMFYIDKSVLVPVDLTESSGLEYGQVPGQVSPPFKEETTEYGWFAIGGQRYLLPSAYSGKTLGTESWRESVLARDNMGNISSLKEKGRPETVILWSYGGRYPVAIIENADMESVVAAMGGQAVVDAVTSIMEPSQSQLAMLANLRTSLVGAHVTTYTHIPGKGVESVTDPAGIKTSFEYDHGGRLVCIRDNEGYKMEEYEYDLLSDENGRRHMHHKILRSDDGQSFSEDVRWWDVYGRTVQDLAIGASGNGSDLVTSYESDFMFHDDVKTWLPYPVQDTEGQFQTDAASAAEEYHGNELAYSFRNYELSARDRVVSEALPGYAGAHESSYMTDIAEGIVNYRWENGNIRNLFPYSSDNVVVNKVTDADGRTRSAYKDHFGRTLATSNGTDAPTYYIYDIYDRLRAVKSSGIAIADTLAMWRYGYDSLGRVSSKGIPGSEREFYTYDEEDRLTSVLRGGVLKEMEYDSFGRVVKVWMTRPEGQRTLLEEHTYDVYPSGVTGGNPKGKKTQSRIAVMASGSSSAGHARTTWSYDAKGRPAIVKTRHADGSEQIEELEYTFSGEVASSVITYIHGNQCDELEVDYTYDIRGRLTKETATLSMSGIAPQTAEVVYGYDELGRPAHRLSSVPGGKTVHSSSAYALQGWQSGLSVTLDDRLLFDQTLGYDGQETMSYYQPQYSGLISVKDESWFPEYGPAVNDREWYTYDYASRLSGEYGSSSRTAYGYDGRGNLLETRLYNPSAITSYTYVNDRLMSMTCSSPDGQDLSEFTYDALGRMTYDGLTGQSVAYNDLDLIGNITRNGTTLVNYSYLADGTKLSALDGDGEGFVYRGPLVYRTSDGGSSLTLESAAFGGGRLTPDRALFYVTDYLGSVRAVVDGTTGDLYKVSDYSTFGSDSDAPSMQTAAAPLGITLRDGYTGKEAQHPDFGTGYIDFGARQYNPALRRWMTPDPLSEKYYGISPYAFCNNNPVNFVDLDGRDIYRYDDRSGTFHLYQKNDDEFDQIAKFKKSKDTGEYELKRGKNGNVKLRIDNIEKGLLSDGINLLTDSQVWSTDDVSIEGFRILLLLILI